MAKEQNLYLLAIVSIVAIVGVVVLILNAGSSTVEVYDEDGNLVGEALRASSFNLKAELKPEAVQEVSVLADSGLSATGDDCGSQRCTDGKVVFCVIERDGSCYCPSCSGDGDDEGGDPEEEETDTGDTGDSEEPVLS